MYKIALFTKPSNKLGIEITGCIGMTLIDMEFSIDPSPCILNRSDLANFDHAPLTTEAMLIFMFRPMFLHAILLLKLPSRGVRYNALVA